MPEITITNWPGVRETGDAKFSFSLNVCNTLHIENGFFDAELAAQALDQAKWHLIESGHMRRSNYYFFPEEITKWEAGLEFPPGPSESLRRFMAAHQPRYPTRAERNAALLSADVVIAPLPTRVKLYAAQETLLKLLAATPGNLTIEEKFACNATLVVLSNLTKP